MVQNIYKSWLLVSQITRGTWRPTDKQWKVQKFKFDGLLSKTYSPSAKTLNTEDLSNITFNYLCENSPNYLCHFWNHKSFFTTQLLCIFLAQTLHTFYKSSPSKCKFSDLPLLGLKFTEFLMSFSNKKSVFLQSLDPFSVSWEIILLYFLGQNFICYWQK